MGLEIKKEKLCIQTRAESSAEHNLETQINLPDYCSDIKRVLKCNITPSVSSLNLSSGKAEVKGSAAVRVVYIGEKDRIDCCEITESFTCSCSLNFEKESSVVSVMPEINYVNCRAVSQRKLSVSSNIGLKFSVSTQENSEILTKAQGDGVQSRKSKMITDNVVCCTRKVFEMSETAAIPSEKEPVAKVMWSKSFAVLDSKKAVSGKLLIKGELYTKIVYCTEQGAAELFEHSMPISQILDVPGLSEECSVIVTADVIQSALCVKSDSSGENRLVEIAVKVASFVKGTKREEYALMDECYCTDYEVNTNFEMGDFSRLVHSADRQLTLKKTVDMPNSLKKVYCVWPVDESAGMDGTGNKAAGKAEITFGFIYADEKNSISYCEKSLDFGFEEVLNESYDKLSCFCKVCVRNVQFDLQQNDKVNLTVQLGLIAEIYHRKEMRFLSSVEIVKDAPKKRSDAALVIYFADKNERIWDIAKEYNTTVEAIKLENEFDGEIIKDEMMLMIPCR